MIVRDGHRERIRLLVVADVRLYRDGLTGALASYDQLTIAGTAGSAADAALAVTSLAPDVALIDVAVAGTLDLFRQLHAQASPTRLIAFGVEEEIATIVDYAEAGAAGYVTLNATIEELVAAIQRIAAGELECTPRVAAALFQRMADRPEHRPAAPGRHDLLTVREQEVLVFLARGLRNKEIAASLHIAEATVKNHVHHLLEKLQVASRVQAAARAQLGGGRNRYASRSALARQAG